MMESKEALKMFFKELWVKLQLRAVVPLMTCPGLWTRGTLCQAIRWN